MIRHTSNQPASSSKPASPFVAVVDDDPSVLAALDNLLRSISVATRLFAAPGELLAAQLPDEPGCIVLDVRLPGISGLDFQEHLAKRGLNRPIVFMTGHGDIPMTVRAMKAGAVDFLAKPFRDQDMLDAVMAAIDRDRANRAANAALVDLRSGLDSLTAREREVMSHVVAGLMNKQVAGILGLSEITVKIHRGNVMRKMGVRTLADLVRKAEALGIKQVP